MKKKRVILRHANADKIILPHEWRNLADTKHSHRFQASEEEQDLADEIRKYKKLLGLNRDQLSQLTGKQGNKKKGIPADPGYMNEKVIRRFINEPYGVAFRPMPKTLMRLTRLRNILKKLWKDVR